MDAGEGRRRNLDDVFEDEPEAAEMRADDWSRLRRALGQDEGERSGGPEPPGAADRTEPDDGGEEAESEGPGLWGAPVEEPPRRPRAPAPDEPEPPGWERPDPGRPERDLKGQPPEREELTLEDLKKPPPEYRDLPGIGAEGGPEQEGHVAMGGGPPDREDEPSELVWEEERAISEVEFAAERLVEEFSAEAGPGEEVGEAEEDAEEDLLAELAPPPRRTVKVGEPESFMGPSWEEPTSRPVTSEPAAPIGAGRNIPAALLTAVVLAAAALISLAWAKAAFAVVAGAVILLAQAELYATMQRRGFQPATALGLVVGAFVLAGAYFRGEQAMVAFVAIGLLATLLWYMAVPAKAREGALGNVGMTALGIVYVPFLAAYFLLLLVQVNSGRALMLAVLGLTFLYDSAAFLFGSIWGSRALAPAISPKKSWEGLVLATVVTFAVAVVVLPEIAPIEPSWARALGLALVVVVFAPLGDLAESMIKRDLGVKDMGSFLPGHGGALDRIDSALFVAPAAFYFVRLFF